MLTGLGVALVSACGPAAGRAAGGAAAKLAAAPIAGVAARWKNRKTRRALAEVTYDALCPHLTPESAKQVAELLETPDFQAIALSIATQVYANAGAKNERKELDFTLERLRQLVALRVPDENLTAEVTQAVWNALLEKTTSQVETVKSSETFSPESRASMLKIAACHAAADAKSAEQLATLSSLAAYHDFEVQLADQIKNLHSTMRLPHAGTTRKVPYSKLFVEPKLRSATKKNESHNAYVRDLDEVIANHHRVVILGDPGGGSQHCHSNWHTTLLVPPSLHPLQESPYCSSSAITSRRSGRAEIQWSRSSNPSAETRTTWNRQREPLNTFSAAGGLL